MAKGVHDDVLDAALDVIALANLEVVCYQDPSDRADVISYALADATMTPGDGNDYTVGDGDTSGRKVAVAEKANQDVDTNGTANYVALCDDTRMLVKTTCVSQVLTAGGTVTIPTWDFEIRDPS